MKLNEERINFAYQIFKELSINVELLTHYEGVEFSYLQDAEKELLSILAVHPMRKDAVEEFLSRSLTPWTLIEDLIEKTYVKEVTFSDYTFLVRNMIQ